MSQFPQLPAGESIKDIIKAAFDTNLPLDGGWGYTQSIATKIVSNPDNIPLVQLEHMIASMRAYLEMNMTQPKKDRYGSINLNEKSRKRVRKEGKLYHHVTYEISAMREDTYAAFIDEYKEGYGKDTFNIEEHFKRRKKATLTRIEPYWFEIGKDVS